MFIILFWLCIEGIVLNPVDDKQPWLACYLEFSVHSQICFIFWFSELNRARSAFPAFSKSGNVVISSQGQIEIAEHKPVTRGPKTEVSMDRPHIKGGPALTRCQRVSRPRSTWRRTVKEESVHLGKSWSAFQ